MKDSRFLLIISVILLLIFIGVPLLVMAGQLEAGDTQTIKKQTTVYDSYQSGSLGKEVCTLPANQEVTIRVILTGNDLPGAKQSVFTEIKAFMVESQKCSGWILPGNFK